jgi:hypothetical protein
MCTQGASFFTKTRTRLAPWSLQSLFPITLPLPSPLASSSWTSEQWRILKRRSHSTAKRSSWVLLASYTIRNISIGCCGGVSHHQLISFRCHHPSVYRFSSSCPPSWRPPWASCCDHFYWNRKQTLLRHTSRHLSTQVNISLFSRSVAHTNKLDPQAQKLCWVASFENLL